MSIISDHKPHVPWRKVRAVVTPNSGDAHHLDVHVAAQDGSIAEWLATAPVTPAQPLLPMERTQVVVHREPTVEQVMARALAEHAYAVHAPVDVLVRENDARMARLARRVGHVERVVRGTARWLESQWATAVAVRRNARAQQLTAQLDSLLGIGDVTPETAARLVALRGRYVSAVDAPSERIPRLTPDLLARLDRTLGLRTPSAPEQDAQVSA